MRILGLIPARGGSKGIPNKNIKLLHGKPLLAYTTEVALKSTLLTKVIVSSDDATILKVASDLGVETPFVRPFSLAQDDTATLDVIIHALKWYETQGVYFDAVCLLQVTYPFRSLSLLENAIKKFKDSNCDSLISVQKVPHEYNPHWTFELNKSGFLNIATGESEIIKRRQELPEAYHRDGAIYITSTKVLLEAHSLYGQRMSFIESPSELYVNIDTLKDWETAEHMIKNIKY
ncbi:MAG: acylneuraminate cytidylyltransferase family protein [Gelidibacter sp.]